jgi:transcriptional regulator with XRE-family HTH domain
MGKAGGGSNDLSAILGQNLRKLRVAAKVSQEEFAARCGYHRTYIGGIERGERNVTLAVLETVAKALEVGPETLIVRTGSDDPRGDL